MDRPNLDAISRSFFAIDADVPIVLPPFEPAMASSEKFRFPEAIHGAAIYIIDSDPYTVTSVRQQLSSEGYNNLKSFSNIRDAQLAINKDSPGLLITGYCFSEAAGLKLLTELRTDKATERLPILVLTAATAVAAKRAALDLGATDFLSKPVDPSDLVPRVRNAALRPKLFQDRLANQAEQLACEVLRRTAELEDSRKEVIHCLGRAAEYRDDVTGRHVIRVGRFAAIIARQLGFSEERAADFGACGSASRCGENWRSGFDPQSSRPGLAARCLP